ncbi:hypothetical protein ZIOFF_004626 [Zingiber officinale]|uniref:Uncharacterized protein n=1 Tax=Zingiber officinale TaxID=94328 RepID=A0A8J5I8M0_ZINOF|nr:hypothetical protein ZIOFF_004626 [Zingiber officinale]
MRSGRQNNDRRCRDRDHQAWRRLVACAIEQGVDRKERPVQTIKQPTQMTQKWSPWMGALEEAQWSALQYRWLPPGSPHLRKVILEAAILTAVVVVSLTLYTFWAARRGHEFNFLGPFLFAAVLMFFCSRSGSYFHLKNC